MHFPHIGNDDTYFLDLNRREFIREKERECNKYHFNNLKIKYYDEIIQDVEE